MIYNSSLCFSESSKIFNWIKQCAARFQCKILAFAIHRYLCRRFGLICHSYKSVIHNLCSKQIYVLATTAYLYMLQLFTHCLPTIICVTLMYIVYVFWTNCVSALATCFCTKMLCLPYVLHSWLFYCFCYSYSTCCVHPVTQCNMRSFWSQRKWYKTQCYMFPGRLIDIWSNLMVIFVVEHFCAGVW